MGLGQVKGINRWSTEDFEGSGNSLYDIIIIDTSYYTLVQIHRMYNTTPKVNDNVN